MDVKKILLRGPNWVGDAVLAIPAMKAIRAGFPQAEITLLARPWVSGVFTGAPFVDTIWAEPKPAGISGWWRLAREIRKKGFDLALLFPNSFESAVMVFLAGVRRRVGYATDGRTWLLTNPLRVEREKRHQVDYYMDLARAVFAGAQSASTEIVADDGWKKQARRLLTSAGIGPHDSYLVLNPGAAYGSAKRWGEDRFAEAADLLAERGQRVVIVGSETERSIAERIRDRMRHKAAVLNGKTSLETLIGVLAQSSLVITNDSGPMHLAAAVGVPTVAIFGPTDETVTSPCGPRTRIVREHVDCSPCMLRDFPIDHRCMTRISAEAVSRAALELMHGQ
jgi:heptosyltransferase-2